MASPWFVSDRVAGDGPLIVLSHRYATGTAACRECAVLPAASSTLA